MMWLTKLALFGVVGGLVPANMAAGLHYPPPAKMKAGWAEKYASYSKGSELCL
jgi:hypothetical protein